MQKTDAENPPFEDLAIQLMTQSQGKERNIISYQKRKELVTLAEAPNMTIKTAAKIAGVHYSTAKHIVKEFRASGHFESVSTRRRALKTLRARQLLSMKHLSASRRTIYSPFPNLAQSASKPEESNFFCSCGSQPEFEAQT